MLNSAFLKNDNKFVSSPRQIKDLLVNTGRYPITRRIKMEIYKQQAMGVLNELERTEINIRTTAAVFRLIPRS